jgi:hypothetical protein
MASSYYTNIGRLEKHCTQLLAGIQEEAADR